VAAESAPGADASAPPADKRGSVGKRGSSGGTSGEGGGWIRTGGSLLATPRLVNEMKEVGRTAMATNPEEPDTPAAEAEGDHRHDSVSFQGYGYILKQPKQKQGIAMVGVARAAKGSRDAKNWVRKFVRLTRDGNMGTYGGYAFLGTVDALREAAESWAALTDVSSIHVEAGERGDLAPWASDDARAAHRERLKAEELKKHDRLLLDEKKLKASAMPAIGEDEGSEAAAAAAVAAAAGAEHGGESHAAAAEEKLWSVFQLAGDTSQSHHEHVALPHRVWVTLRTELAKLGCRSKMVALEEEPVDKEGPIFGKKDMGSGWKLRWARLQGTALSIFRKEGDEVPKLVLDISTYSLRAAPARAAAKIAASAGVEGLGAFRVQQGIGGKFYMDWGV